MKVDVVVPAGGRITGEFAAIAGAEVKALIELGGRTVLERTITALRESDSVEKIVVVGPGEVIDHPASSLADAVLTEGGPSGPANIVRGIRWLSEQGTMADRLLTMTSDLPMVTPQAVDEFLSRCPSDLDICLPVVKREDYEERFPGLKVSFVPLRDGHYTIGCVFLVNPDAYERNITMVEKVFEARKSQMGMASLLGPGLVFKFMMGSLSVADVERQVLSMLGCTGKAIRGCPPELAFDIDEPGEYGYAMALAGAAPESV